MSKSVKKSVLLVVAIALGVMVILKYCPRFTQETIIVDLMEEQSFSDGPYIFNNNDSIHIKWVSEGQLFSQSVESNDVLKIDHNPSLRLKFKDLDQLKQPVSSSYKGVENIAVLSDIHGQYQLFVDLLEVNNIVDKQGDWNYKNGHLVIIGDAFDRGEKVSETLWHIIKLKIQANKAGGKVHYLLGNHDIMVLNADLRYINPKYNKIESLLGLDYDQLFGEQSLMGQWLRVSPVIIRINDILFNHAGLSPAMAKANISIDSINNAFATRIIDNVKDSIRANEHLSLLTRSQGPIWYRGYFKDSTLTTAGVDSILMSFDAKRIVVGHTSMDEVTVYFDTRVLAADTSIKNGENGELLFIENDKYYKSGLDGVKHSLW